MLCSQITSKCSNVSKAQPRITQSPKNKIEQLLLTRSIRQYCRWALPMQWHMGCNVQSKQKEFKQQLWSTWHLLKSVSRFLSFNLIFPTERRFHAQPDKTHHMPWNKILVLVEKLCTHLHLELTVRSTIMSGAELFDAQLCLELFDICWPLEQLSRTGCLLHLSLCPVFVLKLCSLHC